MAAGRSNVIRQYLYGARPGHTQNPELLQCNIPQELRELPNSVVWKYEQVGDRQTKNPYREMA